MAIIVMFWVTTLFALKFHFESCICVIVNNSYLIYSYRV